MKRNHFNLVALIVVLAGNGLGLSSTIAAIDPVFELDAGADREFDGTFVFDAVPSNTADDLATGRLFSVLDGGAHDVSGTIDHLTDGPGQTNFDSCCGPDSESFFAGPAGAEDIFRIQIDLGASFPLSEINSYSWHRNSRAPQIYKVYGAVSPTDSAPDFGAAAFQDDGALAGLGYTLIGAVDSMSVGGAGGQVGVSFAGEIGSFRYLLFDIAPPIWGGGARATFFGEIDIIADPDAPAEFDITQFDYSSEADMLSLTWDSREGDTYAVKYSTDMTNWESDLDDGIEADPGETTTRSFDIAGLASEEGTLFFRVERN